CRAHVIKVTEDELRWLDIDLGERDGSALWLVTDGANGARLVGAHGSAVATAPEVPVVDTTGAGDASLAAVLAMLIQDGGDPLDLPLDTAQQMVQEAVSVGSRVVQHVGATAWLEGIRHD